MEILPGIRYIAEKGIARGAATTALIGAGLLGVYLVKDSIAEAVAGMIDADFRVQARVSSDSLYNQNPRVAAAEKKIVDISTAKKRAFTTADDYLNLGLAILKYPHDRHTQSFNQLNEAKGIILESRTAFEKVRCYLANAEIGSARRITPDFNAEDAQSPLTGIDAGQLFRAYGQVTYFSNDTGGRQSFLETDPRTNDLPDDKTLWPTPDAQNIRYNIMVEPRWVWYKTEGSGQSPQFHVKAADCS